MTKSSRPKKKQERPSKSMLGKGLLAITSLLAMTTQSMFKKLSKPHTDSSPFLNP